MQKIVFIGLFCLFMLPASAFGHKLIPTDGTNIDYESALEIPNPVISWAMYEELQDKPLFYKFDAKKGDRLYSSIVIPKLEPLEDFTPSLVLIGPATFLELVVLEYLKIISILSFGFDIINSGHSIILMLFSSVSNIPNSKISLLFFSL